MLLTSGSYFLFVLLTFALFWILPSKWRWLVMLLASFYFAYSQNQASLIAVASISLFTWFMGTRINQQSQNKKRKFVYRNGIFIIIGFLFTFKYLMFQETFSFTNFARPLSSIHEIIVTVGISYYSLQSIAYLTEVYFQAIPPEKHAGRLALYLVFFPKFLAGPIEPPAKFLNQTLFNVKFNETLFLDGFQRILFGLFKKLVLAERLSYLTQNIFESYSQLHGLTIFAGIILFTFQLYFDLASYADIAIGTSQLFGIKLTENFNRPFNAQSITEFWRRWHMSFIQWLNTYLFTPLAYHFRHNKRKSVIIALFITFIVSGFWHGLGVNFILWGALYALYMAVEFLFAKNNSKKHTKFHQIAGIGYTFILVIFTNLFFHFSNLSEMISLLKGLFNLNNFWPGIFLKDFIWELNGHGEQEFTFYVLLTFILTFGFLILEHAFINPKKLYKASIWKLVLISLIILFFGVFTNINQFLYIIY